jgi:hypothetical protein
MDHAAPVTAVQIRHAQNRECLQYADIYNQPAGNRRRDKGPAPNPATAIPAIMPRLSGNHLTRVANGTIYPSPKPIPPSTP